MLNRCGCHIFLFGLTLMLDGIVNRSSGPTSGRLRLCRSEYPQGMEGCTLSALGADEAASDALAFSH